MPGSRIRNRGHAHWRKNRQASCTPIVNYDWQPLFHLVPRRAVSQRLPRDSRIGCHLRRSLTLAHLSTTPGNAGVVLGGRQTIAVRWCATMEKPAETGFQNLRLDRSQFGRQGCCSFQVGGMGSNYGFTRQMRDPSGADPPHPVEQLGLEPTAKQWIRSDRWPACHSRGCLKAPAAK